MALSLPLPLPLPLNQIHFPWIYVGPAGTGKTRLARQTLAQSLGVPVADVYPKDIRMFKVNDDYECRVYCSPYHFEIDIPDMSMQDKQILVEVLSMLFSAGDVFSGLKTSKRKIVLLRRAHNLSLAAAIRLRWIMETRVCPDGGTGMIWLCAREITGALSVLEDLFVRRRVPVPTEAAWASTWGAHPTLATADAYALFDGRMDRAFAVTRWASSCLSAGNYPRIIANCYEDLIVELLRGCIKGALAGVETPPLLLALWIRERVYDLLGLCQTGIEFLDGYSAATEKAFLAGYCTAPMFKAAIAVVATAEPNTSYRNPISLEKMLLDICIAFWRYAHLESPATLAALESALPVGVHGAGASGNMESGTGDVDESAAYCASTTKKSVTKGAGKAKKRGTNEGGNEIVEVTAAAAAAVAAVAGAVTEKPKPKPRTVKKRVSATAAAEPTTTTVG
jgi:hypothetical protein